MLALLKKKKKKKVKKINRICSNTASPIAFVVDVFFFIKIFLLLLLFFFSISTEYITEFFLIK